MRGFPPPSVVLDQIGPLPTLDLGDLGVPVTRDRPREYAVLQRALDVHQGPCVGDARFTAEPETLTTTDTQDMRRLCLTCPVAVACGTYAAAALPSAGMWAGTQYPPKESENA